MPPETQAQLFIRTLAELRDEQRERQKARLRLQLKGYVKRFVHEFQTDFDDRGLSSEWTPQRKQTEQKAVWQIIDE